MKPTNKKQSYTPRVGDKITVSHKDGLYTDETKGMVYSQGYEIITTNPSDKDREFILIGRGGAKDGKITEVEANWFNTELTGRVIEVLPLSKTVIDNQQRVFLVAGSGWNTQKYFCNMKDIVRCAQEFEPMQPYNISHFWNGSFKRLTKNKVVELLEANQMDATFFKKANRQKA